MQNKVFLIDLYSSSSDQASEWKEEDFTLLYSEELRERLFFFRFHIYLKVTLTKNFCVSNQERIKSILGFRSLLEGFKDEGDPLELIMGQLLSFPFRTKTSSVCLLILRGRVFTSLGWDWATCKPGFRLWNHSGLFSSRRLLSMFQ